MAKSESPKGMPGNSQMTASFSGAVERSNKSPVGQLCHPVWERSHSWQNEDVSPLNMFRLRGKTCPVAYAIDCLE
mgnify:CR=1 FL=1